MVEAIHSTYSYTFSCVYTAYVGGHIIKWVYKYIGFYGCQDLNAHSVYICIKGFGYIGMKFSEEIKRFSRKRLPVNCDLVHITNHTNIGINLSA